MAEQSECVGPSLANTAFDTVYDGSTISLALQALSRDKATPDEIAEARTLLDQLEGKQ